MFSDMTEMLGEENPERITVIDNTSGSFLKLSKTIVFHTYWISYNFLGRNGFVLHQFISTALKGNWNAYLVFSCELRNRVPAYQKGFFELHSYVFWPIPYFKYIFYVKIQLFVTRIRIRIGLPP